VVGVCGAWRIQWRKLGDLLRLQVHGKRRHGLGDREHGEEGPPVDAPSAPPIRQAGDRVDDQLATMPH